MKITQTRMKWYKGVQNVGATIAIGGIIGVVGVAVAATLQHRASALPAPADTMCRSDSLTFTHTTAAYTADGDLLARQAMALDWVRSMLQPLRSPGDGSAIDTDSVYGDGYSGPMSGMVTLAETHPTTSLTPLTVTSPSPITVGYRGVVSGTATIPTAGNYEVRAYLTTDSEYYQPDAIPAVVQPDGSWTINLAPVDTEYAGVWHFRLYDTDTNTQIGQSWPRDVTYRDLVIQYYLVTDSPYLQASQPLNADNSWAFTASASSGEKLFRIVNTTTSEVLAEYYTPPDHGLIRSYEYLPGQDGYGTSRTQNSYMYDQALALMMAIGAGDRSMADTLLSGLRTVQVASGPAAGAFPSGTEQLHPENTDNSYYTGGNAVILYALTRYIEAYGDAHGAGMMLRAGLDYIATVETTSGPAAGLYEGGRELAADGVSLDAISSHSTEHNIDLWHTLERAGRVLGDTTLTAKADALAERIMATLWNEAEGRFNQGFGDTARALDTASWGAIFLNGIGEYDKAVRSAANTAAYAHTSARASGYTPYLRPDSIPTVWYEGTYGVSLAHQTLGDRDAYTSVVSQSLSGQRSGGAFPYADDADLVNGRTDANSVASTAWFLLSTAYPSAIWNECRVVAHDGGDSGTVTPGSEGGETSASTALPGAPNTGVGRGGMTTGLIVAAAIVITIVGVGVMVVRRFGAHSH